ncbi:MAG TPA: hypothetical protein VGV61_18530 [Thermoanaerobaculia bacterium]|jgi:hypothetical protein|nr:hypothetical protein [Thermoanaerobaculia bacterium]
MKPPRGAFLAVALLLGVVAGLLLASRSLEAPSSTLSRGPTGWLLSRLYLTERGAAPALLTQAPTAAEAWPGTLVLGFPWQAHVLEADRDAVLAHLARGGDLLIAYSAEPAPGVGERQLLSAVGVAIDLVDDAPVSPLRWRAFARRPWRLHPAPRWASAVAARAGGPAPELLLRRPRWLPELPRAGALLVGSGGRVMAAEWPQGRGRVVVLPAELLCNARLAAPAALAAPHAALLETLRRSLAGPWRFDEYHHGLGVGDGDGVPVGAQRGLDLLLLQLALLYGVVALALGRRLGPAWRESPPLAGSAASFLLRLGALHHRLRHHEAGARLLLQRAAELDRRLPIDDELRRLAERGDAAALVEVGQRVARLQRR